MDEETIENVQEHNEHVEKPKEEKSNEASCIENENKPIQKQDLEEIVLEDSKTSPNGSEYESVGSAASSSGEEEEEDDEVHHVQHSENEADILDSDSDRSVVLEREEGDGQESVPVRKVDDDEDKKNPQYIPKRGTFYEHDDRTADDSPDKQEPEKNEKQSKKNVWMEKKERWSHDRYNDNDQAPKSRAELVSIYGYDIRNEDGPPRARRRRRYGRGPNKYTRTWEDEEAYKPAKPVKPNVRKPRNNSQEHPSLSNQSNKSDTDMDPENHSNSSQSDIAQTQNNLSPMPAVNNAQLNDVSKSIVQDNGNRKSNSDTVTNRSQRVGTGRIVKHKPELKKEIQDSDYRGFTKTRQFRNSKSEQKILPKGQKREKKEPFQSQYSNKQSNIQDVERDLNKLNIQDGVSKSSGKQNSQRQNSVPPRLQAEQKASKRYSSLRQRSLPETTAPPFTQTLNYYGSDFNQQTPSTQQQGLLPQPSPINAQVPQIAPPPLPPIPQQVPVTATPILQAPPQFATPFPQAPPPFLQPTVPPPPFLPPQAPQLINYVQGQPQFPPAPPPYQGYQHQQFNTVNQPAELYQCQGGTTYYSTQSQHITQRSVPTKRPKAAIPILPPPPQEPRGRGRTINLRDTPPVGDDICDSIPNETNMNYEDAAVILQQ